MANKKISQLFENVYPKTGDLIPVVQNGVTYKVTLDNLNRFQNDSYFVTHNLDPYIIDDLNNRYGRYRFISGNLMISGKGTDARIPHVGSCVLRLYDGNFILNGSGIISGLNGGHTELGHTNNTVGVYNLSVGQFNLTTGSFNAVFGHKNSTTGINLKVIGSGNYVSGSNSDIVGKNNYITGIDLQVNGHDNRLNNTRQVKIFGNYNTGEFFSSGSFIVGQNNYIGNQTEAGANSLVYGDLNKISGKNTLVYGRNNLIKIKSGALEKISVYGLENDVSGIEVDVYGRLNFNAGLTNQIYGHSNTGYGDVNFILGGFNRIQKPVVESYLLGDSNIMHNGSGNYIAGKRNQGKIKDTQVFGDCIIVSGTGNWLAGRDSYYTGIDILAVGRDINVNHSGDFSNIFGRGNTIDGNGYYSDVYGTDNTNRGFKVLIVGKDNTANINSSQASIIGRLNNIYNQKIFVVGEGNNAYRERGYIFGYDNDNSGTSGYIFGQRNLLNTDADNSYIVGRSNSIENYSTNDYIVGLSNNISPYSYNSYIVGKGNASNSSSDCYTFGLNNIMSGNNSNSYILGELNRNYNLSNYNYTLGKSNQIYTGSTNNYIFGLFNRSSGDTDHNYILGKSNDIHTDSTNNYIFGLLNRSSGNTDDNYILGKLNDIYTDSTDNCILGYTNLVGSGLYSNTIIGRNNLNYSYNSTIIGNGITLPLYGNGGYKLQDSNMNGAMQIGVSNVGKITILSNGNIGVGTQLGAPFENPQELIHVRSGNVLFDATQGGYFKFYDKNEYNNIIDNPSQFDQPGDIRAIVSGGNFKIDGDLILSTGIGETGQFLAGRIFQEAFTRNLDGSMWCYAPSNLGGSCDNTSNPYSNSTENIIGTDQINYTHKVGLWGPTGLDLGWDTPGSPTVTHQGGYDNGYISNASVKDGAIAQPDFCNGNCNFDYQPHEIGRIGGIATTFLDGTPTSAIITGRYTLVNTPIMKTTNLYLPPVIQNSGVLYTVKNLGKGNIMIFSRPNEKIDLFFTGFMIDQRFASYEFLSNGSGWFLV
jgi:hypothetical protein